MRLIWHIVIDNMNTVDENTFGKKVGRVINAEMYAWDWQDDFSQSRHLLQSALLDDVYEVHSSGFIKQKPDPKIMLKAAPITIISLNSFLSDVA